MPETSTKKTSASPPGAAAPRFGVLLANWNGEAFIERCLGTVLAAVRRTGLVMPVVVVDDASGDASPELIRRGFPSVRLARLEQNVGYGQAVNRGMRELDADWVFLLNNDLALQADFCERLIAALEASNPERLFAIGAQTRDWETQAPNHAGQRLAWRAGMLWQEPFEAREAAATDFFQAGACLIDRRKFLALGGFAPLYHPGYWEDYDLAFQALRRGWVNLYEPRAVAFHCGQGSMRRRWGDFGVSLLLRRNHLLFMWANLTDWGLLAQHLAGLARLVATDRPAPGQAGWGRALAAALAKLPEILRLRRSRLTPSPAADRRLLHLLD